MVTLYFKCKLLSDIVMTQKSATEGHHRTLDFIPGNNFLGIVARSVYNDKEIDEEVKVSLFHNGDVRYGDAHPMIDNNRTLRVAASLFYPKLSNISKEAYVYYLIPDIKSDEMRKKQLKQCRNGFYMMDEQNAKPVELKTKYSIKSAYDKAKRRSEDEKMYGYQALPKGLIFCFQVDAANEYFADIVKKSLVGIKNVGRSKTAEYGLVEISVLDKPYNQPSSRDGVMSINGEGYVAVYADSRLIFFDEYGMPTLQPTPQQLGVENGIEVDWSKSQIRTFQYAPYNSKRAQYDYDRYGIEKGSVFVVRTDSFSVPSDVVIGSYQNEGFGKVIYNPNFLKADCKGRSCMKFMEKDNTDISEYSSEINMNEKDIDVVLLSFLRSKCMHSEMNEELFESVNSFVDKYSYLFKDVEFASQWGTIRKEASRILKDNTINDKVKNLNELLFDKKNGYLLHGVAKNKWDEKNRADLLREFVDEQVSNVQMQDKVLEIVINLASQMSKIRR